MISSKGLARCHYRAKQLLHKYILRHILKSHLNVNGFISIFEMDINDCDLEQEFCQWSKSQHVTVLMRNKSSKCFFVNDAHILQQLNNHFCKQLFQIYSNTISSF